MATLLDTADTEHFHYPRNVYCLMLAKTIKSNF